MIDMLDKLGFRTSLVLPSNDAGALPQIVISQIRGS
ncbi:XRE family transcriptional regulator [Pseudomonas sp. S32]|nr:XRE family transcriptional regulator [Pseudomonas sp. S32]